MKLMERTEVVTQGQKEDLGRKDPAIVGSALFATENGHV
jgi:hypothetical protein